MQFDASMAQKPAAPRQQSNPLQLNAELLNFYGQGSTSVKGYFPQAAWHALWNGSSDVDASKGGKYEVLATPLGESNVHVRGGAIVPLQEAALTTAAVRDSPLSLLIALPHLEVRSSVASAKMQKTSRTAW